MMAQFQGRNWLPGTIIKPIVIVNMITYSWDILRENSFRVDFHQPQKDCPDFEAGTPG
jgi:hypothetical protein